MIKLAPNLSWLFADLPFNDRPSAAARAGFSVFEFGFYGGADLEAVERAVSDGMTVALFNMDVPDWGQGGRGWLSHPQERVQFLRALEDGLEVGRRIQAGAMMVPAGRRDPAFSRQEQLESCVVNLAYAAPLAEEAGLTLTLEVLNPADAPGYFLTSSAEALEIVNQVNHPRVKFQFDTYHLYSLEGRLIETLQDNLEAIGHIQVGDAPGRVAPGGGEIDIIGFVEAAEAAGYPGVYGLEYHPGDDPLGWIPPGWLTSA